MSTTYTKSISGDLGGSVRTDQLHDEIDESIISVELEGITTNGDVVDIVFVSALSGVEQTTLDTILSNHAPDFSKPRKNFFIITPKQKLKGKSYVLAASFNYPGSSEIGTIDYIDMVAYNDKQVTSFDARVVDTSSGLTIAERTVMASNVYQKFDLGVISDVPEFSSLLELHIRKNGGKNRNAVALESLTVYYNN